MAAALHKREGVGGAFKGEDLIDQGPQSVRSDGAVHRFEPRARADRDALDVRTIGPINWRMSTTAW